MKLRHYQDKTFGLIEESILEGHNTIVVVAPTGAGKTVIFSHLAKQAFISGKKTLIDVNRVELLSQAKNKCEAIGLVPTMVSAKTGNRHGHVYIAMVETLARRMAKGYNPHVDILILDEAHIKVHDKIIDRLRENNPKMLVLGFTATPARGNKPMPPIYTKLVEIASTQEMVDWGYLVKDKTFGPREDFSDVKTGKDGDFDADDLYRKMKESNIFGGIVDNYKKNANGLKSICFSPSVAASVDMTKAFNDAGISARHLDGGMDAGTRAKILKDFSAGLFLVLCNVNIATTGFDEPSVQCVIVNRATKILSLWLQMVGRGSRPNIDLPHPTPEERKAAIAASSKPHFVVLDHGSNWTRHSLWSSDREWSLVAKKKTDSGGVAAIKECLGCGALLKASARVCEYCEYEMPIIEKVAKEASEFVEIELPKMPVHLEGKAFRDMTVQELEDRRIYGNGVKEHGEGWVVAMLKDKARNMAADAAAEGKFISPNSFYTPLLQEYAEIKNYKPGWVFRKSSENLEPKREKTVMKPYESLNLFENLL